jgi:hypothetical protein
MLQDVSNADEYALNFITNKLTIILLARELYYIFGRAWLTLGAAGRKCR